MTIKSMLQDGASLIEEKSKTAALDVEVLMMHVLGLSREEMFMEGVDKELSEMEEELFRKYLERVAEGEPVAYIIGKKEFYGLDFYVDERVLLPRPETEHLVERCLAFVRGNDLEDVRILDVGTGSGAIAVSLAVNLKRAELDAVDISEDALEVARVNVQQHGVEDRVYLFQSDLLESIEEGDYDIIVANLPYIGEEKHRHVDESVEKHEPGLALFAGEDGLDLYKRMFEEILEKEIGFRVMICEFGFGQSEDLSALLEQYFPGKWLIDKDYAGIDRIFIVSIHV